jgi:O-antigen/teichoic acid export membrane protein
MNDNSKIVKNSLILYIRLIITSVFGLLSSRFILQALGASDFGLYNVVGGIVLMIAFLNNVMVSTTYRYISFEIGREESNNVNKVFNICLVIHIFLAIFILLFAESVGVYYIRNFLNIEAVKIGDALFVFHLSILITFFSILSAPFQGLITAKEKFSVIATIEVFRSFFVLGVVLLVMGYSGNRLRLYSILIAILFILFSFPYFLYSLHRYSTIIKWNFQKEKRKYKEMIGFSSWMMFGAAASAGEAQGSALIINLFFGTILNASFGIANQVNNVVKMFSQSLNQAVIPQITKTYSSGNTDRTMLLVIFSSKYSFLLMLLPSLPILLETDYILKIWLTTVPEYTSTFIKIMIINALISTMNAGIPAAVQATGKIKYFQIFISSMILIGLPISYISFKNGLPPYVLLLIYTIITLINLFIMQVLLKHLMHFNIKEFLKKGYLRMMMVSVGISPLFLLRYLFESNIFRFIGITLFSVSWLLSAIYILGLEKKEKEIIGNYLRKVFVK